MSETPENLQQTEVDGSVIESPVVVEVTEQPAVVESVSEPELQPEQEPAKDIRPRQLALMNQNMWKIRALFQGNQMSNLKKHLPVWQQFCGCFLQLKY